VVLFDYRYQGASQGEPRGQIFPWEQIEDFRNAITFASMEPEADPERIGIFGSSYSGGHVICIGALDRRVKCVASQVPLIDGWANAQAINTRVNLAGFLKYLQADRVERYKTGKVSYLPVVAADNNAVLNTSDSYQWFTETAKAMAPRWENRVTVESLEKFIEYTPGVFLPRISPTPFLMMVSENDILTPTDIAVSAFETAREPKKLVILPGGHFDAYVKGFPISSGNATAWFKQHLLT
jgi:acetyl esterase/lipase